MIYLANLVFRLGQLPGTRKGSEWPEYKTASTNWYVCAVYSMCTYIHVHVYIHVCTSTFICMYISLNCGFFLNDNLCHLNFRFQ